MIFKGTNTLVFPLKAGLFIRFGQVNFEEAYLILIHFI